MFIYRRKLNLYCSYKNYQLVYYEFITCTIKIGDNMIDFGAIGRKIKLYRKKINLTQFQLAEKLDVTSNYISAVERGITKVSLTRLDEIAAILNISVADLFTDCNTESKTYGYNEIFELTKDQTPEQKSLLIDIPNTINSSRNNFEEL